jgi:hypothetical protein
VSVLKRRSARAGTSIAEMAIAYSAVDADTPRAVRARAMPGNLTARELPRWRALVATVEGVLSGRVRACSATHWGSPHPSLPDHERAARAVREGRWRVVNCGRTANRFYAERRLPGSRALDAATAAGRRAP